MGFLIWILIGFPIGILEGFPIGILIGFFIGLLIGFLMGIQPNPIQARDFNWISNKHHNGNFNVESDKISYNF